jgi:lipid-A-disaccharide synthase
VGSLFGVMPRVFISVAEDSADLHGASLVRAARGLLPGVTFEGFAGPRMQAEGVAALADLTQHAAMLAGAVKLLGRGWNALRTARRRWAESRPDLVVLMDSTALHLPMARMAKAAGLPTLYYIAPQTWASRPGRNRKLARDVDQVACILPFEEAFFRAAGVNATFVGHPLFEHLATVRPDAERVAGLRGKRPLVALLPGSRAGVIERILPLQLRVVLALRTPVDVAVSCASDRRRAQIDGILARAGAADVRVVTGENASLLTAADAVLVASGTATLEVAYFRKPMVVMYDAGPLLHLGYRLGGRRLLHTKHLSLVNILAGQELVPEFMPFVPRIEPVAEALGQLLRDPERSAALGRELDGLVRPLEGGSASARVCRLIAERIGVQIA